MSASSSDTAVSASPPQIRPFAAEFADPELERQYRVSCLREDARLMLILMCVVLPANALWLISDYIASESGPSFGLMLAVRVLVIATGIVALIGCYRTKSPAVFTACVHAAGVALIGGIFFFDLTRPVDYLGHYTIDVIVLVALYLVTPVPVRYQAAGALFYTAAMIWFFFEYKESPHRGLYTFNIPVTATIANFIGYLASRSLNIRRRREFYLFERESEARAELETALENVKTLSGLLPICAGCKKIRDDKGYWNHVEKYLAERSEVSFTHGLCPECRDHYLEGEKVKSEHKS